MGPAVATVVPAAPEHLEDVITILGANEQSCLCQYWRMSSGDYSRSTQPTRVAALRAQLAGTPAPGMLAYVDAEPTGWLGFGPRNRVERLVRSRTIPKVDDVAVSRHIQSTQRAAGSTAPPHT